MKQHRQMPFHRVNRWNGKFFAVGALWQVGLRIYLGHDGMPCPHSQHSDVAHNNDEEDSTDPTEADLPDFGDPEDSEDEDIIDMEEISGGRPHILPIPKVADWFGYQFVTFVDVSGIHKLPVVPCTCNQDSEEHVMYFDLGLFPASYDHIKTAFTFSVLNDFRLSNLECKTSAYQYYSKLRWITSPAFPKLVENRYQELR